MKCFFTKNRKIKFVYGHLKPPINKHFYRPEKSEKEDWEYVGF